MKTVLREIVKIITLIDTTHSCWENLKVCCHTSPSTNSFWWSIGKQIAVNAQYAPLNNYDPKRKELSWSFQGCDLYARPDDLFWLFFFVLFFKPRSSFLLKKLGK
ncbi:hypothetical protein CEXT_700991 [Caerostris extrusa]|uniref:Uncharacterized protein n=1 Tax=Caerostris extrusa TaxID=172846 RepID=A0AAV4XBJ6_CAEEX|nr:hypothetical protein CEXT_700991 [Caerostris extrusa]